MFACFDDRGRLYVAGSSGHNLDAAALRKDPPDVIRCLEDTDGDGRFDQSTVFADRLTYPEGILWHDGAIYTASPPSLWRLEDTDHDGVADRRQELVTGFPFTGIADDLHGPCLGPDGRLYWGVGRFDYDIRKPGGSLIRHGRTPLIMRCRPDGDEVEVFSAAMGNPVEMAFTAEGEPFASGTFLSPESQGEGLRDAIIHCVYGGLYSVRDRDLAGEVHTGDLLPPLAHLGVAAASGMVRARGGDFGGDDRDVLYAALFNLQSVPRLVLHRNGATFRAAIEPFLDSDVSDFHPTDVLEDADGSMLVVDTGGWFRSCPTSQIDKPNVFGGIYRIRRVGAARVGDPWGRKIDWPGLGSRELARLLDDPRFAVRDHAATALVAQGDAAVHALWGVLRRGRARARIGAVWVLARIASDAARAGVREALHDRDPRVRLAAVTAAGLNRDARAFERLRELVRMGTPAVRREAAMSLGRLDRPEAAPALIEGLRSGGDRFVEHALILALIRLKSRRDTLAALDDPSPAVRRGALIALEQMPRARLALEKVRPLLEAPDPGLRQAALWVVARHPEWAGAMTETFRRWLARDAEAEANAEAGAGATSAGGGDDFRPQLIAFAREPATQAVIAEALEGDATATAIRIHLLEVMRSAAIPEWPESWVGAMHKALGDPDERVARQALSVVGSAGRSEFDAQLLELARDPARGEDLRVEALEALGARPRRVNPALVSFLVARLGPNEPPLRRMKAAVALGQARLDNTELLELAQTVGQAGALILPHSLQADRCSSDAAVGAALVAALDNAPGLPNLAPDALESIVNIYPEPVRQNGRRLLPRLQPQEQEKAARLATLVPALGSGDILRGHDVFFGTRATCSTCHTIRTQGGHVGPDLSRIGAVRSRRDLLEAILYPSASFARGFEPFTIATRDGRVRSGIITRETNDTIVLTTPDRREVFVPRAQIEEIAPSKTSIMPRGLDANLSRQDLADLVAYLQAQQ
jgi:putative membrane-bound dehydrogenase-like protein